MGVLELPIHFPKVRLPFFPTVATSHILFLMTFFFFPPFPLHLQNACPSATVSGAVSQQKLSIWTRGRLFPLALPCYVGFWSQSPTCKHTSLETPVEEWERKPDSPARREKHCKSSKCQKASVLYCIGSLFFCRVLAHYLQSSNTQLILWWNFRPSKVWVDIKVG